jgi:hypothetical protein
MPRKENVALRPLFAEWPAWQQLPWEVRQQLEHLLTNMCLEIIQPHHHQESSDERTSDYDRTS